MAQIFFMSSWDLSQPTRNYPHIFKKSNHPIVESVELHKEIAYAYYIY